MKLVWALTAVMAAVLLVSFYVYRNSAEVTPCDERVVSEAADGRNLATVTERTCDGSVTTHVSLRRTGTPPAAAGEVFAAPGASPTKVLWQEGQLVIESPAPKVLREETHWREVPVRIRLVR